MICDPQALLSDGRCFYAANPFMLLVAQTALWCEIAEAIEAGGLTITDPVILSDDGLWYQISANNLGGGDGTLSIGDAAQPPGTHPYLVILDVDGVTKYKLSLHGTPPAITYTIDETPTLEPANTVVLTDGPVQFSLRTDAGPTIKLIQI